MQRGRASAKPGGLISRCSVCKTRACLRTWDRWPNGFTSWLASSRKSQKASNFTPQIRMTCDQLVSTRRWGPNGEKLALICVRIWARPKLTQVVASARKWAAKRNASWMHLARAKRVKSPPAIPRVFGLQLWNLAVLLILTCSFSWWGSFLWFMKFNLC